MKSNIKAYFISAFRPENDFSKNVNNSNKLYHSLVDQQLAPTDCIGNYNGITELSYMIVADSTYEALLLDLASQFKQECILVVHDDNRAEFVYCDGKREYMGWMREIKDNEKLSDYKGYSFVNDKYYTIKEK